MNSFKSNLNGQGGRQQKAQVESFYGVQSYCSEQQQEREISENEIWLSDLRGTRRGIFSSKCPEDVG